MKNTFKSILAMAIIVLLLASAGLTSCSKSKSGKKFLAEYEKLVAKAEKAAKKNDMKSLMDLSVAAADFAEKVEDLSLEDNWTTADAEKYLDLTNRYTAAVSKMSDSDFDINLNETEKSAKKDKAKPSGKIDKALNGEWKDTDENDVFSFDNGKVTYFRISDGTMRRGIYETITGVNDFGIPAKGVLITFDEEYNFETGKWVDGELKETEFEYEFLDGRETLRMIYYLFGLPVGYEYKKGKYLKNLIAKETENAKEIKKINAMSVDKLKKQKPALESDFEVKPIDDSFTSIKITKYKGSDPLVVIPATMQGLPVKRIEGEAFKNNGNLVAVVIPEGVMCIESSTFKDCKNLHTVVLPSTMKWIDSEAFCSCFNLKTIDMPAGLLRIQNEAFEKSGLTSVNLPEGLLCIARGAFDYTSLTSISLPKSLMICNRAFRNCDSLAEINIPVDNSIENGGRNFVEDFSGAKINESIALQKMLKETEGLEYSLSFDEYLSFWDDIAKQIGAKKFDENEVLIW